MYWLFHLLTRPQIHDDFQPLIDLLVTKTWSSTIVDLQSHPELKHSLAPFIQQVNEHFPPGIDQNNGKKAVALYTALCPLYQILNGILRRPQSDWKTRAFQLAIHPFRSYIPYLLKGLEEDCPFHPSHQSLYRCISGDPYHVLTEFPMLRKDETHTITAFTSTCDNATTNNQNILNFIGATDVYTVIEIYNCPFGRQIKAISLHPYQDEVLLVPGLSFRVDAIIQTVPRLCPYCQQTNLLRCNHCNHLRNLRIIEIKWNFISFKCHYVPVSITMNEPEYITINLSEYPLPPSPKFLSPILFSPPPSSPKRIENSLPHPVLGRPNSCFLDQKAVELLARDYLHDGPLIRIRPETIWGITVTVKDAKTGTVVHGTGGNQAAALRRANFALEQNTNAFYQNEYNQQRSSFLILQEQQQKQQLEYQKQLNDYLEKKQQQEILYLENQRAIENEFSEKLYEYQENCADIYQNNLKAIEDAKIILLLQNFKKIVKHASFQILLNSVLQGGVALYDILTKDTLKNNLNKKEKQKYVRNAILEGTKKISIHLIVCGLVQMILIKKKIWNVKITEPFLTAVCQTISEILTQKKISIKWIVKILFKHTIFTFITASIIQRTKFTSPYAIAIFSFLSNWILVKVLERQ